MRVARLLFAAFPFRFIFAVALGVLAGALGSAVISLLSIAASSRGDSGWMGAAFVAAAIGLLVTSVFARLRFLALSDHVLVDLRLRLARSILDAPVPALEKVGNAALIGALTDDVYRLGAAASALVKMLAAAGTILGVFVYLVVSSPALTLLLVVLYVVGFFLYRALERNGRARLAQAIVKRRRTFTALTGVVAGTKELKLHRQRQRAYLREVDESLRVFHEGLFSALDLLGWGESVQQAAYFVIVGFIALGMPLLTGPDPHIAAFVLGILYLTGPTFGLIAGAGDLALTQVVADDLGKLGLTVSDPRPASPPPPRQSFRKIELVAVQRKVQTDDDREFMLGPLDLTVEPGMILFLAGGNGSGKTTLAKILLGLYPPDSGHVLLDGAPPPSNLEYRSLFAAVFAEGYVFDRVHGVPPERADAEGTKLIRRFGLADKVSISGGAYSRTDLSRGQQKRLALVSLLLEDRPFYLFDEWAAEQDPDWKRVFYTEVLPELRDRGKAVVVVSHDDHYFHVADRLVYLEDGRERAAPVLPGATLSEKVRECVS